jgi:prepilin-type N-terminal cleavage/methylation domain-containing protein
MKVMMLDYREEHGFTLIELLVVMGIIGVLSAAAALTFGVVMKISPSAMEQNNELSQVHLVGSWISSDMKNAYYFSISTPVCSMKCREGANFDEYNITYTIEDSVLIRTRQKLNPVGQLETMIVARSIDADHTGFILDPADSTGKYYKLTVMADSNQSNADNITRIYKLKWGY